MWLAQYRHPVMWSAAGQAMAVDERNRVEISKRRQVVELVLLLEDRIKGITITVVECEVNNYAINYIKLLNVCISISLARGNVSFISHIMLATLFFDSFFRIACCGSLF